MKTFKKALTASAVAVAMAAPMAANATNGILPLGNGMTAHGFGGAGIANAGDVMAGVDNPALVSGTSNQKGIGVSIFSPSRAIEIGGGYVDSENDYFLIPQAGYTSNIDSKMDWGILVTALGGMNAEYPGTSFGLPGGTVGMDLMGLVISPTLSYKANNNTSVGVSLLIGYEALETFGPGLSFGMPANASDSATGYGLKLGVVSKVSNSTSVGFTYQSEISMSEMDTFCSDPNAGIFGAASDCALNMPPQIGLGVTHQINPKVKFVGDIIKVSWSDVAVFDETFGWEDQTIVKFGFEYKANENTVYRFGINHGKSPIPDTHVATNLLAPAVTEDHLTFGIGKKMGNNAEINGYFAYILENEQTQNPAVDLDGPGPAPAYNQKAKMDQFALGVGWNWKY